jgi:hypothetical protein
VLSRKPAEHASTLKLIERLQHQFDVATPTGGDYQPGGKPASPREGLDSISDLHYLFVVDDR